MSSGEIWKAIAGYEGFYEVSSLGRVRSLDRMVGCRWGGVRRFPGRIISPSVGHGGYAQLDLYRDGEAMRFRVHALVSSAFLGPRPPGMDTSHLDGDGSNNRVSNLVYESRSANMGRTLEHGTRAQGSKLPQSKLDERSVREMRKRNACGETATSLAAEFGVTVGAACSAIRGDTWGHV